jgi:hypothetical protein
MKNEGGESQVETRNIMRHFGCRRRDSGLRFHWFNRSGNPLTCFVEGENESTYTKSSIRKNPGLKPEVLDRMDIQWGCKVKAFVTNGYRGNLR